MMKPLYYIRHLLTALLIWMAAGTLHAQFDARRATTTPPQWGELSG